MKNTLDIYVNYGCLGSEKRRVYTHGNPAGNESCYEKMTVSAPEGWKLYETVTGETAVKSPWGQCYSINEVLAGNKDPMFIAIDDTGKEHRIKLQEVNA